MIEIKMVVGQKIKIQYPDDLATLKLLKILHNGKIRIGITARPETRITRS